MSEKYFPGFEFRKFEQPKTFEIISIPYERKDEPLNPAETVRLPAKTIRLDDLENDWGDITEPSLEVWNPNQVMQEFTRQLSFLDAQVVYPRLTMRRRTMKFVTSDEMLPQTDEDRQRLIQRYGDYGADGGAGDCKRFPNGTFTMRIGFAGQENSASKVDVLEVMSHEYGHTLGEYLDDPVLEELKAYTFANLLMRYFYNAKEIHRLYIMDESSVHDTATFWLEQLLDKGVSEEAVLAHLTGKRFGNSYANDYLK